MNGSQADMSRIYAAALFELARDRQAVDDVQADLSSLAAAVAGERGFLTLSASPYVSRQNKAELLNKIFKSHVSGLTMDFLQVANKHSRVAFLPLIAKEYEKLRDDYRGCWLIHVTVSRAMSNEEAQNLAHELSSNLNREVKLDIKIDPSIIGGIIIRYGDTVIDNTIKRKLKDAVKTITAQAISRS